MQPASLTTDLTPSTNGQTIADPGAVQDLVESAVDRHERAKNENTERNYRAGWELFTGFCQRRGLDARPASPETVVLFIEHLARTGYAFSTIQARLASITHYHHEAGHKSPCRTRPVRKQKKSVRRTMDDPTPNQKAPVLMEDLRSMDFDEGNLSDLRDRALLFIGFAGGFRRSELVGLRVKDMNQAPGGTIFHLRRSKTDQEGRGRYVQIPNSVPGLDPTPNEALSEWLSAAGIESGPLFRGVDRWDNVQDSALSGQAVYDVVRDRMEGVGADPCQYSAHSLRAGYATQGYLDGVGEHEIADQTGHRKMETLRSYQRVNVVLDDHPLTRMGIAST